MLMASEFIGACIFLVGIGVILTFIGSHIFKKNTYLTELKQIEIEEKKLQLAIQQERLRNETLKRL